jgi:coproporphyrinogen III oxidase
MKEQFYKYIQNLQDQITGLEAVDGHAKFQEDLGNVWKVEEEERVIENGAVLKRRSKCFCGAW